MTKLIEYARSGNLKGLKEQLARTDVDVSATEQETGFTALHAATAWQNDVCVYELLLDTRVNSISRDYLGRRPIDLLVTSEQSNLGKILREGTYAKIFHRLASSGKYLSILPVSILSRRARTTNQNTK